VENHLTAVSYIQYNQGRYVDEISSEKFKNASQKMDIGKEEFLHKAKQ
jgi:hypothetical protein